MSPRSLRTWAWGLFVVSLASVGGLQYGLIARLDRWDAWQYATLAHGAILPAVAACGLAWRFGGTAQKAATTVLTVVLLAVWLHTWFVPVKWLAAWIVLHWHYWMGV